MYEHTAQHYQQHILNRKKSRTTHIINDFKFFAKQTHHLVTTSTYYAKGEREKSVLVRHILLISLSNATGKKENTTLI